MANQPSDEVARAQADLPFRAAHGRARRGLRRGGLRFELALERRAEPRCLRARLLGSLLQWSSLRRAGERHRCAPSRDASPRRRSRRRGPLPDPHLSSRPSTQSPTWARQPIFVDSDRASWNLDPELLAEALEDRARLGKLPRAVMVVHLYGQSADLDPILATCARHGVKPSSRTRPRRSEPCTKGRQVGTFTPVSGLLLQRKQDHHHHRRRDALGVRIRRVSPRRASGRSKRAIRASPTSTPRSATTTV